MNASASIIYITIPNKTQAYLIGQALLEDNLIACANIISNVESIYKWQGKIETAQEFILIAKTTKTLVDNVIDRVQKLHEYECPCIISLNVENGNKIFLKWIENSVNNDIS
jgi:periplasmic divalent cation tolerance protein